MNKTSIDISSMLDDDFSDSNLDAKKALLVIVYFFSTIKFLPYLLEFALPTILSKNTGILIFTTTIFSTFFSTITTIMLTKRICKGTEKRTRIVDPAWVLGKPVHLLNGTLFGIATYFVLIFIAAALPDNTSTVSNQNFYNSEKFALENFGILLVLITTILTYTVSSIAEELFFRGVVLAGLTKSLGSSVSIFLTSIFFILYHYPKLNSIDILTYILISSLTIHLRLKYKAIGPAIALHLSFNLSLIIMVSITILIN